MKMAVIKIIIISFTIIGSGLAYSAELPPIDEGTGDPSFANFRRELLTTISRKDKIRLLRIVSPDIISSFGGEGGKDEFVRHWHLDSPKTKIWLELQWILTHGGSFDREQGSFWAPYVYSKWPDEYDSFNHAAAVEAAVPVLKARPGNSPVIGMLRYSIVRIIEESWWEKKPDEFIKIQYGRMEGFVQASKLRSPIAYRACFQKIDGSWYLTRLVEGD